jgi:hypothetical protein
LTGQGQNTHIKRHPEGTSLLGTQPLRPAVRHLLIHKKVLLKRSILALSQPGAPKDAVADFEARDLGTDGDDDAAALAANYDGPGGNDGCACVLHYGFTGEVLARLVEGGGKGRTSGTGGRGEMAEGKGEGGKD